MSPPDPAPPQDDATAAGTLPIPGWTPTRNEIKAWMHRNAPSLAELYEGAVTLLYTNRIPGHVRFIAHAVREIRNRLPEAVAGPTKNQVLQYKNRLDIIAALPSARTLIANVGGTTAPITTSITIEKQLGDKIAALIQDHLTTRAKPIDAARRLFQSIAPDNTPTQDTLTPVLKQWIDTTDWFVARAHDSGHTDNHYPNGELRHRFAMFENAISAATRPFFDTLEDLDAILEDTNT